MRSVFFFFWSKYMNYIVKNFFHKSYIIILKRDISHQIMFT